MNIPFFSRNERSAAVPVLRELDAARICENEAVVSDPGLRELVGSYRQVEFGMRNMGVALGDAQRLVAISEAITNRLETEFHLTLAQTDAVADFVTNFPEVVIR